MFDVIVIGGGPAGVTAALRARELGASVALVERGQLGGTCTNDGCAPTRVLARAARLVRDSRQFGEFGLVGAPAAVDFSRVLACTQASIDRLHEKNSWPLICARPVSICSPRAAAPPSSTITPWPWPTARSCRGRPSSSAPAAGPAASLSPAANTL